MARKKAAAEPLAQRRLKRAFETWSQGQNEDDFEEGGLFTLFALEAILGNDDLYEAALEDALMGSGGDGGIDAMLTLFNNEPLDESRTSREIPTGSTIALHLLQATKKDQMETARLNRARTSIEDILNLDEELPLDKTGGDYNERFVEKARVFRETVSNGTGKKLKIEVVFHLANTGDLTKAKEDFRRACRRINNLKTALPAAQISSKVYGARELLKLFELKGRIKTQPIQCEEVLRVGEEEENDLLRSRLAIAKLSEYDKFVTETSKNDAGEPVRRIREALFAGNVRHFRGATGVNAKIRESLQAAAAGELDADFWALNNGITILASGIEEKSDKLTIHEPLVVNGLQTSFVLNAFFAGDPRDAADESIVLKVVVAADEAARAAIIRGTNQQTPVQTWSLYAAEERQVAIAEHFAENGWFYERLAGQSRWEGKPRDKTIDMRFLAQAVLSIGLNQPEEARARPGGVFTEKGYPRVFNEDISDEMYLWLGRTLKSVDQFLMPRKNFAARGERATLRFHVARQVVAREIGAVVRNPAQIRELVEQGKTFTDKEMETSLKDVRRAVSRTGETAERASKTEDLRKKLDASLKRLQGATRKAGGRTAKKKSLPRKAAARRAGASRRRKSA